jgi:uncharacterized protein (TIGR02996 family)
MTHEEAFLEAIRESPEDDAPRLVFADWLDEHGDPARAEFIRVQCTLARTPTADARYQTLYLREARLLQENRERWDPFFHRSGRVHVQFRRGFIELLAPRVEHFVKHSAELFAAAPTACKAYLDDVDHRTAARLAEVAGLSRLRVLSLRGQYNREGMGPAGARALAASPHLANLTALHLDYQDVSDEGARALAASPYLSRLTTLSLVHTGIGDAGVQAIVQSPTLAGLASLDLDQNHLSDDAVRALAGWPALARHTVLKLCFRRQYGDPFGIAVGPAGVAALAASAHAANLRELYLEGHAVGDAGVEVLAASAHLGRLETLTVQPIHPSREGWQGPGPPPGTLTEASALALAASPHLTGLRTLDLYGNLLGDPGAELLAASPNLAGLVTLDLGNNDVGEEGIRALAASPYLGNLERLNLVANRLTDAAGLLLASWPRSSRLRRLNLYHGFSEGVNRALLDRFGDDVNLDERKYYDFWNG